MVLLLPNPTTVESVFLFQILLMPADFTFKMMPLIKKSMNLDLGVSCLLLNLWFYHYAMIVKRIGIVRLL